MLIRTSFAAATVLVVVSHAPAQTIQLPTFGYTTVATTVKVPDRGQVHMGGINRARLNRRQIGTPLIGRLPVIGRPFNNVGIGRELSSSHISATAYIHDFEAMDQALLAEAAARRGGGMVARRGTTAPRRIGLNPAAPSVAQLQRRPATPTKTVDDEMQDLLNRARSAEAKGKPHVAKIFYRMISREATGSLKELAQNRLDQLNGVVPSKIATR
jgi:hypothetical protein